MKPKQFEDDHGNPQWKMDKEDEEVLEDPALQDQKLRLTASDTKLANIETYLSEHYPESNVLTVDAAVIQILDTFEKLSPSEILHIPNLPKHHVNAVSFLLKEARELAKGRAVDNDEAEFVFATVEDRLRLQLDETIGTAQKNKNDLATFLPDIISAAALLLGHLTDTQTKRTVPVEVYANRVERTPNTHPTQVVDTNRSLDLRSIDELKRSIEEPLKRAARVFADRIGPKPTNGNHE